MGIYQGTGSGISVLYDHADPLIGADPFQPMIDGGLVPMRDHMSSHFTFPYQVMRLPRAGRGSIGLPSDLP
ncbi:MAG: hypothetical protein ACI9F9_001152 [Candidatus Paceibacteria bacterium]|jgi:hypothetical protein